MDRHGELEGSREGFGRGLGRARFLRGVLALDAAAFLQSSRRDATHQPRVRAKRATLGRVRMPLYPVRVLQDLGIARSPCTPRWNPDAPPRVSIADSLLQDQCGTSSSVVLKTIWSAQDMYVSGVFDPTVFSQGPMNSPHPNPPKAEEGTRAVNHSRWLAN